MSLCLVVQIKFLSARRTTNTEYFVTVLEDFQRSFPGFMKENPNFGSFGVCLFDVSSHVFLLFFRH